MTTVIERGCTFTHNGRTFENAGAVVSPDICIGYVGKLITANQHILTDWHGNQIGTIRLASCWRTPRSFVSNVMYQAYATVNGVQYTGRTCGEGMIFCGKPVKS